MQRNTKMDDQTDRMIEEKKKGKKIVGKTDDRLQSATSECLQVLQVSTGLE